MLHNPPRPSDAFSDRAVFCFRLLLHHQATTSSSTIKFNNSDSALLAVFPFHFYKTPCHHARRGGYRTTIQRQRARIKMSLDCAFIALIDLIDDGEESADDAQQQTVSKPRNNKKSTTETCKFLNH